MDGGKVFEIPLLLRRKLSVRLIKLEPIDAHCSDDDPEPILIHRLKEFSLQTTAHGLSRIGQSKSYCGMLCWAFFFTICLVMFLSQGFLVVEKYQQHEKIVNIEVVFSPSQYPAVTICNLNPFKKSLARLVPSIRYTLDAFDKANSDSKVQSASQRKEREVMKQVRDLEARQILLRYQVSVYAQCNCGTNSLTECVPIKTLEPSSDNDTCLCVLDVARKTLLSCFHNRFWKESDCPHCKENGECESPVGNSNASSRTNPCLCQTQVTPNICLARPEQINKIWEVSQGTSPATERPTRTDGFARAMGFAGMTDSMAIQSRAKENLVFASASLTMQERILMSYESTELIEWCSFNGHACDIVKDFKLHVDPVYGNCYIFSSDSSQNLTSRHAGPLYGLILMVKINVSDYISSSSAAGVRIVVHGQTEFPFPDTLGHNAPTGLVSSFGIKRRRVTRLPAPYGDCTENGLDEKYIYQNYDYHPEGCQRSCFQRALLKRCSCGDPRLPLLDDQTHCSAFNATARKCLEEKMAELGDFHFSNRLNCSCRLPCHHNVYSVTFSCARWPSAVSDLGDCNDMSPEKCFKHYKEEAAMIEVYYEQLNFESLTESQAYGLVNVIADFGGQLGLWMGISVLTCVEFVDLIWDLITIGCKCFHERRLRNHM